MTPFVQKSKFTAPRGLALTVSLRVGDVQSVDACAAPSAAPFI